MSRLRRNLALFASAIVAVLLCAAVWFVPRATRGIRIGTGVVSHTLCSGIFVSGLDPDQLFAEALKPSPGLALLSKRLRIDVDRNHRQVTATWAGLVQSRSIYRDGLGCLLIRDATAENTAQAVTQKMTLQSPSGATNAFRRAEASPANAAQPIGLELAPPSPKLEAALDRAFAEPSQPPFHHVKAIVILHDGKIVAERYAPGYNANTPILGYSVAKSVTSALVGILVREGKLSVDQPAPVAAWADPRDPRRDITIDQLLRMTSGLAIEESDSGFDPVSRMLFLEPDMAGFAERANLKAPPGTQWEYTSGNTLILSRIIRDAVGGHAQDVVDFAHRELFAPLGITTATMEFDATGTPVGSIYTFASARDWAKFGELYRNDGVVNQIGVANENPDATESGAANGKGTNGKTVVTGKRILPEGWVKYSATPTLNSDYGAGFWTNHAAHGDAQDRIAAGMPEDAFYASGNLGQRIVIIPSQNLVIVRLGLTHSPSFDMPGLLHLIADTTSALNSR